MEQVSPGLVILGVIGLIGNTIAVVVGAYLTSRSAKRAQADALLAQVATVTASENAFKARKAAADAARELIRAARSSDDRLEHLRTVAEETNEIASITHKIVNNQRTVMLRLVADLSARIAKDNPGDEAAQHACLQAAEDAADAVKQNL